MNEYQTGRPSVLTVEQAASRLKVSRSLVYSLIEAGKLTCHRIGIGRGTIRLSSTDLETFLKTCRTSESPPPADLPPDSVNTTE